MSQFIRLSLKITALCFFKAASWDLGTIDNLCSQNYLCFEHLIKVDIRSTNCNAYVDRFSVSVTTDDSVSVVNHTRKNKNVTFWSHPALTVQICQKIDLFLPKGVWWFILFLSPRLETRTKIMFLPLLSNPQLSYR